MPGSASGDAHLERRGTAARDPRGGTSPRAGSSRYAITAVSWSERATSSVEPVHQLLGAVRDERRTAGVDERGAAAATYGRVARASCRVDVGDRTVVARPSRAARSRLRPGAPSHSSFDRVRVAGLGDRPRVARGRGRVARDRRPRRRRVVSARTPRPPTPRPPRAAAAAACGTRAGRRARAPARGPTHPAQIGRVDVDLDSRDATDDISRLRSTRSAHSPRFCRCFGGSSSRCSRCLRGSP